MWNYNIAIAMFLNLSAKMASQLMDSNEIRPERSLSIEEQKGVGDYL